MDNEYDPDAVEQKWQTRWVEDRTYEYDGDAETDPNTVFAIDAPPPTVSGNVHWGNTYGFILQDFVARFQRMRGRETFFPFGYDNNGIASERLTEDELDIRHQDYSRREFQQKVREVCREYEETFAETMRGLGCSMDWSNTYKTIEPRVQRISQLSFIDLYEKGREYRKQAPAIWCPDCETAISQVEMEDSERSAHFNDIAFETDSGSVVVSTTRPELLAACVAVFVHPDDDRSESLVGETAVVPLFGHEVPILADERVETDVGTGIVMCCTFGDQTDIEWYQAHDLPLRVAIDESGTMTDLAGPYEGLSRGDAREAIVEDLREEGHLQDRRSIEHTVRVHERCDADVEFLVTEQWYVELLDRTEEYLEAGREMEWYPEKMFARYRNWIEGLEWDWCISRQRDSGIPFPVWYCSDCDEVIVAERDQLPVDPIADDPPVATCPNCGGEEFDPETDVFDTWATSSLTPLINAGWDGEELARPELYPMDLRPQGHDIISFWLFHTVVKCLEHTGEVPFESVMLNGMVLDENREAMSKSRGNVITPQEVLSEFPVDAARYWAAGTSVGDDFPFRRKELVTGERLLRKLWNASRLVDELVADGGDPVPPEELEAIDRWLLARLDAVVRTVTDHLEAYEFAKARNALRSFFWNTFCDDYLEITKQRVRDAPESAESARHALATAHATILKLFAPLVPHVTEEIWTELYGDGSVHTADWPTPLGIDADLAAGETAMAVISALRKYKSQNQLPLNAELPRVDVYGDVAGFEDVIERVTHARNLQTHEELPETVTEVTEVSLDYAVVGPTYGEKVGEIEAALDEGDFEVRDDRLHVAGVELEPGAFELDERRAYDGDGTMFDADGTVVVVADG